MSDIECEGGIIIGIGVKGIVGDRGRDEVFPGVKFGIGRKEVSVSELIIGVIAVVPRDGINTAHESAEDKG